MSKLLNLLTSFTGRIGRGQFWFGLMLIVGLTIVLSVAVNPPDFGSDKPPAPPTLAEKLVVLAMLWPTMAITIKRLNDRDWPSWLGIAVLVVFLPWYVGPFFGAFDPVELIKGAGAKWEMWYSTFVVVAALPLAIDNCFLRGTDGPNRYGADPLGRRMQAA